MWWEYVGDRIGRQPLAGVPPLPLSDEEMLEAEASYRSRFPATDKFDEPIPDDVVRASGLYEPRDGDRPLRADERPLEASATPEAPQGAATDDQDAASSGEKE